MYPPILNKIISADLQAADFFLALRNPELTQFFTYVTVLGKSYTVVAIALIIAVILYARQKRIYIIPLLVSLAGSGLFTWLGKQIVQRARPDMAIYAEHSFSFPSGHAAFAVALYGFVTYILACELKSRQAKMAALFFGFAIIFAIGFSRLYLGVHYLSDVLAGYLVGALWLLLSITVTEWLKSRAKPAD